MSEPTDPFSPDDAPRDPTPLDYASRSTELVRYLYGSVTGNFVAGWLHTIGIVLASGFVGFAFGIPLVASWRGPVILFICLGLFPAAFLTSAIRAHGPVTRQGYLQGVLTAVGIVFLLAGLCFGMIAR